MNLPDDVVRIIISFARPIYPYMEEFKDLCDKLSDEIPRSHEMLYLLDIKMKSWYHPNYYFQNRFKDVNVGNYYYHKWFIKTFVEPKLEPKIDKKLILTRDKLLDDLEDFYEHHFGYYVTYIKKNKF